jgi:putative ABC transport system permease protein
VTATLGVPPARVVENDGGASARRAVIRWAWRMFRREWSQQARILLLLGLAVAATTVGLAVVSNVTEVRASSTFGTANTLVTLPKSGADLGAELAAARSQFGTVDVVTHRSIPIPGSVATVDLRSENPHGPFVAPTVRLDRGRYPVASDEVAVTSTVAVDFHLHVGGVWSISGRPLRVVGLVEDPLNLLDHFALVPPGQDGSGATVDVLFDGSAQSLQGFQQRLQALPGSHGGIGISQRGSGSQAAAEALTLVLGTLGLLFVGLLGTASFAVMAQRRLRALGMFGSLGATDRHLRLVMLANGAVVGLVAATAGVVAGLVGWLVFAPLLQSIVEHEIDRFAVPWWAIALAWVLACLSAVAAAWWPARAVARLPIVAALSGRPPRPQPAHRFAAAGGLLLGAGLVLLAFTDKHRAPFIIGGTITTVVGLLLLAPLTINALARFGRRAPIAIRLALRDLARYQARSGAALAAVTMAVGIAATIAIAAAASAAPSPVPNLPSNQLNVYPGSQGEQAGNALPLLGAAQRASLRPRIDALAGTLGAQNVLPIELAYSGQSGSVPAPPGAAGAANAVVPTMLAKVTAVRGPDGQPGQDIQGVVELYVATPALLARYGIPPSAISPTADVITSRKDTGGLALFSPQAGPPSPGPNVAVGARPGPGLGGPKGDTMAHPVIQVLGQLPSYTSDPTTLLTTRAVQALGLKVAPAGWIIDTPHALTTAQIDTAQKTAASLGLSVESRSTAHSLASLRNWATTAGILVALGVLAMTVGLIRSESANDLRTLTATGATSLTRRTLTSATAGALAVLGAALGIAGAYAAMLAWYRSDLHPLGQVPVGNLVIILVGLPAIAVTAGWLLAEGQPPSIARRPLD